MATFEELTERLMQAAAAGERIEAAEKLARLDDPRVAPALARAMADADASVRQRVEELLGDFCHRDRAGSLNVLLAEAERVASALAAETQRLRGFAPDEPRPATVEPILPPEAARGECALVRLTTGPMDIKRVSRTVAAALGVPVFGVTREIHTSKGFLARGVAAGVARALVAELAKAGVVAGAVPMEALPPPLEFLRLRNPTFGPEALRGQLLPDGEADVAWESVALAVAGRMEMELESGALDEDWRPFTHPLRPRGGARLEKEPDYNYIIELFAGEPPQRLRLLTHDLDFKAMQRRPPRFGKVAQLARDLLRHVDRQRATAGVRRLADRDEENWDNLTFTSPIGYEDYVTWQRLLLALGVPLPR